jgi:hypothetical protein
MLGGVIQKDVSAFHVSMSTPHAPPFIIIYIWVDTKLPLTWHNNKDKNIMKRQKKKMKQVLIFYF